MRKYIFFIVLTFLCSAQSTGFAIYGVGENIQNNDPASLSMGNSQFFSGNSKNISTGSPSSIWRSSLTRFTIHSGMNILKSSQFPKQYHQSLTSFSLLFPVGNKKVFGFGLQPVYRTNKLDMRGEKFQFIGANENSTGMPIAFKNNYSIDGGISELFLEYSQKLYPHFSGGFKYSFLFGNQYIEDKLFSYDVIYDRPNSVYSLIIKDDDTLFAINEVITGVNKFRKFSGIIFSLEGRYTGEKQECVLKTSVSGKITVETQNIQTADNTTYTNSFINSSNAIISELGLGYLYQIKNNSGITMELHKKYPFNIPENAASFNVMPPEENSVHMGSYYQIRNSRVGFWNNLNVRGGTYLKGLNFTGEIFLDYGATLGIGIEYLGNSQSVDFSFRAGKMESRIIYGKYEEYISLNIGITTGEKWFLKRRRKKIEE